MKPMSCNEGTCLQKNDFALLLVVYGAGANSGQRADVELSKR